MDSGTAPSSLLRQVLGPGFLGREAPCADPWASLRDVDTWDHNGPGERRESVGWASGLHQTPALPLPAVGPGNIP